jgi:O-antigen/teichoic acid export membrane protein
MTGATQRFLNYSMGQNDQEQLRNVYSTSLILHLIISVLIIFLAETIGLWFFYTWLNIPIERQSTAVIVYHFSVVTIAISILQVPYRALIIAYEKMSFFAFISIIEVLLKLAVVFLLSVILFDSLRLYSFLILIIGIIIFFIHKIYCNKKFVTVHFRYSKDKSLFRQLASFSGWSIFGQFADVSSSHGTNILVNIFFGVAVNAAMGIANQVNSAVYTFVSNFQTAFKPQIIKSYAAKNYDDFKLLIFQTSKISYFLLLLFVLPLYINADFVLSIWLKSVPLYAVVFTQLMLLNSLEIALTDPIWISLQATGNIKKDQLIFALIRFSNMPLSFLFLKIGFNPISVLIIRIILNIFVFLWRLYFLKNKIHLSLIKYLYEVIIPILIITSISAFITYFCKNFFVNWLRLIFSCFVSSICISCLVYFFGLTLKEKTLLKDWIKHIFSLDQKSKIIAKNEICE